MSIESNQTQVQLQVQDKDKDQKEKRTPRLRYSKTGCLSCKRRKKKCDERHPICSACERNNLCCAWQQTTTTITTMDSKASSSNNIDASLVDVPKRDVRRASSIQLNTKVLGLSALILDEKSAKLFDHFVNHFVPVISPPHADPRSSPLALMVPQVYTNPVVSDLVLACGAMDLSWTSPAARDVADVYYTKCIRNIREAITNRTALPDDDWLFTAMLFLALYEKWYGGSTARALAHLSGAYYLIMERYRNYMDIRLVTTIRPVDKMLLESFLFNAAVAVLYTDDKDLCKLPSPQMFDLLLSLLHKPTKVIPPEDQFPWQENAVMGCAVDLYSYMTRISWLNRKIYCDADNVNVNILPAFKWLEDLKAWSPPRLSTIDPKRRDFQTIQMHFIICRILKNSLVLLLTKTLYPNKSCSTDPEIVDLLEKSTNELENIPERIRSNCILPWPLAILGFAAVKPTHRMLIKKRMLHIGELSHAALATNLSALFDVAWAPGGPGFDIIYNRDLMVTSPP